MKGVEEEEGVVCPVHPELVPSAQSSQPLHHTNLTPNLISQHEEEEEQTSAPASQHANICNSLFVIVDPISTGALLAADVCARGVGCVRVQSSIHPDELQNMLPAGFDISWAADLQHDGTTNVDGLAKQLQSLRKPILAVVPGCETGVELADALAARLGLTHNDVSLSKMRRNKFLMGEQIRKSGVRSVQQIRGSSWKDVEQFVMDYPSTPYRLIVKPEQSAGTDSVYLCTTPQEVQSRFEQILGKSNILGQINEGVLVQEFLDGIEYVVDTVSSNGHHKVVALWEYDKREANGKRFIYHSIRFMDGREPRAAELMSYMLKVLDALAIHHGPAHGEVMYTADGPVLVEVGARPHGGEGSWSPIPRKCLGYDVCTATVDLYTDIQNFQRIPDIPILKDMYGIEVYFVSRVHGKLVGYQNLDRVEALPSYIRVCWYLELMGKNIEPTTDCLSMPGSVVFVHHDKNQLLMDVEVFQQYSLEGFFVVESSKSPVSNGKVTLAGQEVPSIPTPQVDDQVKVDEEYKENQANLIPLCASSSSNPIFPSVTELPVSTSDQDQDQHQERDQDQQELVQTTPD